MNNTIESIASYLYRNQPECFSAIAKERRAEASLDIAKAIIKAREEKQTRTCDPDCPFCKTEEASK